MPEALKPTSRSLPSLKRGTRAPTPTPVVDVSVSDTGVASVSAGEFLKSPLVRLQLDAVARLRLASVSRRAG